MVQRGRSESESLGLSQGGFSTLTEPEGTGWPMAFVLQPREQQAITEGLTAVVTTIELLNMLEVVYEHVRSQPSSSILTNIAVV